MTSIYLFSIYEAIKLSEDFCISHFPNRYKKACRYVNDRDKYLCIGAGFLLSEILKCDEKKLVFSKYGKPELLNRNFNISHSGSYSVLVVSDNQTGIDIEFEDYRHLPLKNSVCSDLENNFINDNPIDNFYLLWTIKESVLKNIGSGLTDDIYNLPALNAITDGFLIYNGQNFYCRSFVYKNHVCSVSNNLPIDNLNIYLASIDSIQKIKSDVKFLM